MTGPFGIWEYAGENVYKHERNPRDGATAQGRLAGGAPRTETVSDFVQIQLKKRE